MNMQKHNDSGLADKYSLGSQHAQKSYLTTEQVASFWEKGYLVTSRIFQHNALDEIQICLDELFDQISHLPKNAVYELGNEECKLGDLRQPQILRPSQYSSKLLESTVYKTCRRLATELLGHTAHYVFDHAIYKYPTNRCVTEWHQDQAYLGPSINLRTVNIWVPLQDVTIANGCLSYAPYSHLNGLRAHQKRSTGRDAHVLVSTYEPSDVETCEIIAGTVCIHHPLTLHYAAANSTNKIRRTWTLHFGPKGRWEYAMPINAFGLLRNKLGNLLKR